MQVFLPYADFTKSAKCLDKKRLFKQTWECKQLLNAILRIKTGWRNHCITRTWESHAFLLYEFFKACTEECKERQMIGFADATEWMESLSLEQSHELLAGSNESTDFLSSDWYHLAYQSHLLAKNEEYYSQFNWEVEPKSGYWAKNKSGEWQQYSIK